MQTYDDFRLASDRDFALASEHPTQEAHVVARYWREEQFWISLSHCLANLSDVAEQPGDVRSEQVIFRDAHLQAVLDVMQVLPAPQHAMLMDCSMRILSAVARPLDLKELIELPLHKVLADVGAGGITTVIQWILTLQSKSPATCGDFLASVGPMAELRLICELSSDEAIGMSGYDDRTKESAAWLLMINAIAQTRQGRAVDTQIKALSTLVFDGGIESFAGWPLLLLIDEASLLLGEVDTMPVFGNDPFGKPDLNVGTLAWHGNPSIVDERVWPLIVNAEVSNPKAFAGKMSNTNSFRTSPRLQKVIKAFIRDHSDVLMDLQLNLEQFKNLESLGVSESFLMKHPQASERYSGEVFSRDLGL